MSLIANGAGESGASNFYNGAVSSSLRMQNGRLTRTPSATGNPKKWTFSAWIKRGTLGDSYIFAGSPLAAGYDGIAAIYLNGDQLHTYYDTSGANPYGAVGPRLYRDTSSWYHLVWAVDAANTIHKIWVNNELVSTDTGKYPPNVNYGMNNSGDEMVIGDGSWDSYGSVDFNGYMAEINYLDNQYLEPDAFAETKNGIWIPLKDPSLTYGTNGFRLQFLQTGTSANSSGIGADTSGEANHFAVNALVASDCNMPDSPENNFATINPVIKSGNTFSEGNLKVTTTTTTPAKFVSTLGVTSGKWFMEFRHSGDGNYPFGITSDTQQRDYLGMSDGSTSVSIWGTSSNSNAFVNGSQVSWGGSGTTWSAGDIIGLALNADDSILEVYKNGSSIGSYDYSGLNWSEHFFAGGNYVAGTYSPNFGQDSTFQGAISAGGNADANGIGDFKYAVPSSYLALCSANLPEPTIGPNSDTQADDYFDTLLYTGNGSARDIGGLGFKPDWVWVKGRSYADHHAVFDSSRGVLKILYTNGNYDEDDASDTLDEFRSDGFGINGTGADLMNKNSATYVAWNWKANGSTTSSNSSGSITSTVQANVASGFSIILYAGNSTKGATIGHGLSAAPEMVWFKNRDADAGWAVYNKDLTDNGYALLLNSNATEDNRNTQFLNETSPSSTLITLGDWNEANAGSNYVAYAFHSVEGYSKIGNYIGNVNADGAFVFTGFRPALVIVKRINGGSSYDWFIHDNKRGAFNVNDERLAPNATDQESTSITSMDFLSNGFKIRTANTSYNEGTVIYMAFAEAPFKYANAK